MLSTILGTADIIKYRQNSCPQRLSELEDVRGFTGQPPFTDKKTEIQRNTVSGSL